MANSIFRRSQPEILSDTASDKACAPKHTPFWAEFAPTRIARIILLRAGIAPLEGVRPEQDKPSAGTVTSAETVTYSAEQPKCANE